MCISIFTQEAQRFDDATLLCRDQGARVCTYEDLYYVYRRGNIDATYNPISKLLGNFVSDDGVLCGNKEITSEIDSNVNNFEGQCNKADRRNYWCCHN